MKQARPLARPSGRSGGYRTSRYELKGLELNRREPANLRVRSTGHMGDSLRRVAKICRTVAKHARSLVSGCKTIFDAEKIEEWSRVRNLSVEPRSRLRLRSRRS